MTEINEERNEPGPTKEDPSAEQILEKITECFGKDVGRAFQGENSWLHLARRVAYSSYFLFVVLNPNLAPLNDKGNLFPVFLKEQSHQFLVSL